jgi:lipopolysaccharide export system permease protein
MLKKLHILFIKSFIGPFIGTFFIALFLLLMQSIWKYLGDLVGKGLELTIIAEFVFYSAIHLIPLALPLALLLSSIMVFGNLAERYELVAIKSAGVSLIRAMIPMFLITILLSIGAFYTANNFIPKANLSWGALLYDITQKKPAMNITDKVFFKDIKGYAIRVGKKHDDNQTIEDVLIYIDDKRNQGNNTILLAERGKMYITDNKQFMVLELENGKRYQEMVDDKNYAERMPHNIMKFDHYAMSIDLSELDFQRTEKERFSEDHRMLNVAQLKSRIDSLERYIVKKKSNLYRYLDPYFHRLDDTTDLSELKDTSVSKRLEYLIAKSKTINEPKPDKQRIQLAAEDSINSSLGNSSKLLQNMTRPKKITAIDKVSLTEDAIQNINNAKRISNNNTISTSNEEELQIRYIVERYRKYTLAISIIVLFFIGAPLGAIIKKGGFGLPLVISILLFIVYYVMNMFGEKLVKEGTVDPLVGMWFSTWVLFPVAIFLTYKASTDSNLFERDFYKKFIPWMK